MPMELPERHVATLPPRLRALLARAGDEEGLRQLYLLAVASQMLRERLDAVDHQLHTLLQHIDGADHVVADDPPAARDLLAALADIAEHLGQGDGDRGVGA